MQANVSSCIILLHDVHFIVYTIYLLAYSCYISNDKGHGKK